MLKYLPFLLIVAVTAIVATRYLLSDCQQPLVVKHALSFASAASAGKGQAQFPDALRISQLNAVQLDYSYTYGIYHSRGYMTCPASSQRGYLHLHRPVDCRALFQEVLADQTGQLLPTPPKWMPALYRNEYLLDGAVDLQSMPTSDVYNGNPTALEWSREHLDDMVVRAGKREHLHYGPWSHAVYNSLASVDIKGQKGLVVGSETPWVEAAILHAGAAHVVTSEYRRINSSHPQHSAYHPREQAQQFLDGELQPFDFAFTYSSIEHSGLGRYGDPLDPNGDLKETAKLSCLVKPGGLLFLGLPINLDTVVFNVHRLYGPVRLPLVTANWAVQSVFGKDSKKSISNLTPYFFRDERDDWETQLVIIAKNNREAPCS